MKIKIFITNDDLEEISDAEDCTVASIKKAIKSNPIEFMQAWDDPKHTIFDITFID